MLADSIICVGAVYIDTILTVPHFPIEDEKLRAGKITRRRGGNTANTLEVLAQLLEHDTAVTNTKNLGLISVLPDQSSNAASFIVDSLPNVSVRESCIFRHGFHEAASSYIIQNAQTLSRTIVSLNELADMSALEFELQVSTMARTSSDSVANSTWFHFEGRAPELTLIYVHFLREKFPHFRISVECEHPERQGMVEVAELADVVFYSKLWAAKQGYKDAPSFLESQLKAASDGQLLCCTWGAGGATAVLRNGPQDVEHANITAWQPPSAESAQVIDTIGAGDSFIAGMLFALNNHGKDWTLQQKLGFANQVAGRKVRQEGFGGLGRKMLQSGAPE